MTEKLIRRFSTLLFLSSLLALSSCGGGGSNGENDNPCGTVVDIGPNSIVDGVLQDGDCRVDDIFPGAGDTSFVDEYRVTLNDQGTLNITMSSTDLDSFLVLLDTSTSCARGCDPALIIATDDDSGGGFDSFISMDLDAGTYGIGANSFTINPVGGAYTLTTSVTRDILYVDDDDPTCGGQSPCFEAVQDAVDAAIRRTTIIVLPGFYVENIQIVGKQIVLKSASGASVTEFDGGGNGPVIFIGEGADVTIEGFTIRNAGGSIGSSENGYGIVVTPDTEARATIRNNVLTQNFVRGGIGVLRGVVEVQIQRNEVIDNFRGIEVEGAEGFVEIVNNVVAFNRADPGGPTGGGIFLIGNLILDVVNNTVYGNEAVFGGGLGANASNLTLLNNIFFANTASSTGPDLYLVQDALNATVVYNIIGDGQFDGVDNNFAGDPLLVNPVLGNFGLQLASPAIDMGLNAGAPDIDFAGNFRPLDGDGDETATVDIGAFESL